PSAANANALDQAKQREQYGTPHADAVVSRYEADQRRRGTGQQQGCDQCRLAADPITPMTENRGPDRPPDKANEKDAERLQHTHQRVGLREKERAKNQRAYGAVKQKVIPLDRGSDRARYQRTE